MSPMRPKPLFPRVRWAFLVLVVGLRLPATGQLPTFPSEEQLRDKSEGDLVLRAGEYGGAPADWGYLLVPENRNTFRPKLLRLQVVRQRATRGASAPPIFYLAGGPGASNLFGSGEIPSRLLERSEVVRVGYRGIDSDPELTCPELTRAWQTARPLAALSIERARAVLRACNERLRSSGVDLDGYSLAEVVEDVEALRLALGVAKIRFFAVSWGTQIAYAYAVRHPERVDRMLLVGAGAPERGFDLWDPTLLDRKLAVYARLWREDEARVERLPDPLVSLHQGLASLPREWRGLHVDPDKVRLAAWNLLAETATAGQLFEAVAAAVEGDFAGFALLSWAHDEHLRSELARPHGPYDGEFFSKVMSSGLDAERDWARDMDPAGSLLGSPLAKLLWGAASHGGWPIEVVPAEYRTNRRVFAETVVLAGDLDVAAPLEYVRDELLPYLEKGHLVVLEHAGHGDLMKRQPVAFEHLAVRFLVEGVVDDSKFTFQPVDFAPEQTLGDQARALLPAAVAENH
jgi:pimeloyl-ACP methyl ester carboxylesterase